ncbi:MAG: RelA/SpoT family protein [Candidatus Kaiserbacteria bacterium]|nr:RelA/SpoT family protein [Candidatus Kaiserbacteria bacterium]
MPQKQKQYITAKDIIAAMQQKCTARERKMIEQACTFAQEKHQGQTRYSGEPYYTHPLEVGRLLAEIGMAAEVITAGMLHDTIEDTDTTIKELEKMFGKKVAFFVDGVSHLGKVRYQGLDARVKSLQKLLVATSKDIRVIIIKLMDRLHNMRTLEAVPKTKQKRIAKETQQVYAPIADRLGMGMIKTELEELAFKHLDPTTYTTLKKEIDTTIGSISMAAIEKKVKKVLVAMDITTATISSRIKSVYSTAMKMRHKKYALEQIQDLTALRILVHTIPDAYNVLGILHAEWRSIPGAFKDYISLPKPNGYQALHTRILIDKHILEVQILTHDMYQHAQFGVAAHFEYKGKRHGTVSLELEWFDKLLANKKGEKQVPWAERIAAMQRETVEDPDFMGTMQADFLQERMFIFTPKGEVVDLPQKATPVDFAFAIHGDIGKHAEGAFVNGKYVSLRHELQNGDIVNIKTGKKTTVNKKWLDWVKTSEARARIRNAIKKSS